MLYSSAGFLALLIHLVINHDVMRGGIGGELIPAHRAYRSFLLTVTVYYVTDILWGLLYERHLVTLTFLDTMVYYESMAVSILYWTLFAIAYMRHKI